MQIKETSLNQATVYNASVNKAVDPNNKPASKDSASKDRTVTQAAWQKDILMQAIDKLENKRQLDNNHPLDRREAAPIESFDEAMNELQFVFSDKFLAEASPAQANINAQDVLYLFAND